MSRNVSPRCPRSLVQPFPVKLSQVVESRLKQVSRNFSLYYITYFDIILYISFFHVCTRFRVVPFHGSGAPIYRSLIVVGVDSPRLPLLVRASIDQPSRERGTFRVLALTLRKQPASSTLLALDWPPGSVTAP